MAIHYTKNEIMNVKPPENDLLRYLNFSNYFFETYKINLTNKEVDELSKRIEQFNQDKNKSELPY